MDLVHWDDLRPRPVDFGPLAGTWYDLGRAAGTTQVGARRIVIPPGKRSTPVHVHTAEEEIFFVIGGAGLSWQDGETFEVRAGDALLHRPRAETHTLIAGDGGLDVFAFSTRVPTEASHLPRAGVSWLGDRSWTDAGGGGHPFAQEVEAGALELPDAPSPRPDRIVALADVPAQRTEHGGHRLTERELGRAMGSKLSTLAHVTIDAGCEGYPPHCHSSEEELFVMLDGAGVLLLGDEELPLRPGNAFTRPPSTKVAHSFRAAQDTDLVYLVYGDLLPNDIAYYPRSGKIAFRGLGVIGRIEPLGYWDGEP
jgi:uncharacterized cupin superfamily protein